MNKKIIGVIAALVLGVSGFYAFASDNSKVVATYSGINVTEREVMDQFKAVFDAQPEMKNKKFSELDVNIQKSLITSYVNGKLIEAKVSKSGVRDTNEFKEKIKLASNQLEQQIYIENFLKENVTDKMINEEYNKFTKEMKGQKEIKTSHILVEDESTALDIKRKIDAGEKFADMASKYSKDEGSKTKGGSIGYTLKGQLVPEYENVAFNLAKGAVSTPVKSQFGWHIIKLEDKRDAAIPSKKEATAAITQKLNRDALEKMFENASKEANVELKI